MELTICQSPVWTLLQACVDDHPWCHEAWHSSTYRGMWWVHCSEGWKRNMNHCSSQSDRNSVQDLFTFHFSLFHPVWILVMFSTLDVFCLYIIVQNVSTVWRVFKVLAVKSILHLHNQHWWILQCNHAITSKYLRTTTTTTATTTTTTSTTTTTTTPAAAAAAAATATATTTRSARHEAPVSKTLILM